VHYSQTSHDSELSMNTNNENTPWLERPIHPAMPALTNERVIFGALLLVAALSRLYNLGVRVMSHDESLHTYFSWLLYKGDGYQHNPMMHGPLQFHLIALSYFLFGPSDFSARLPAAFFNVATIALAWHWRRYLGKAGGLIAALLMLISPIMLFYGRYVREDPYAIFSGVLMLYVVLRYLEGGERKFLYLLTVALLLHFIDKETAFIYTAELLIFLAVYFIVRVTRRTWEDARTFRAFIVALSLGILLVAAGLGLGLVSRQNATLGATEVASPANPTASPSPLEAPGAAASPLALVAVAGLCALAAASFFLLRGYTWQRVKSERSFDLLVVAGTMVLPMLVPFMLKLAQAQLKIQIPTSAAELQSLTPSNTAVVGAFLASAFGLSILFGQLWRRDWWKLALTFWMPFTVFYTTMFTNTDGFFTGVVGSLGYWLVQQGVQRGSQPWYYYLLVLIPVYEFLPLLGSVLAVVVALRRRRTITTRTRAEAEAAAQSTEAANFSNTFSLLAWWIVASLAAFSMAGEKMPWLTYHLTWPLILFAAWGLGWIVDTTAWRELRERRALLIVGLVFVFFTSLASALLAATGPSAPFQGQDLDQLQSTGAFLLPALAAVGSAAGLIYLLRDWVEGQIVRTFVLTFYALLAILTVRAAFRAAYINYDDATEYLVYAHASTAVKDVIRQAAEISQRTTGGMGVNIAYDASAPDTGVSWPFVWYLRDFTNQHSFDQPTRALRDSTIVVVDSKNFDKIEQALGPGYYRIDYIRMWWPNQDYFGLVSDRQPAPFDDTYSCRGVLGFLRLFPTKDFSRVCSALADPKIRAGIVDIWLNRDYSAYAAATGHTDLTLATWQPSDQMRMYIKKDVAQQIWKYGVAPSAQPAAAVDPYQGKTITLAADPIISAAAVTPPMNAPRAIAFAPDGSFYVADSRNHRILHFDGTGQLVQQWGAPSGNSLNNPNPSAAPGTFNEPWGVAVGPDGAVLVTDTWNYRVQKFTSDGQFLKMWSSFGTGAQQETFYGPRGIAVDGSGHVYVVDTGNKRIVVFDENGAYITQFGSAGLDPGKFDEPVGIAIDAGGIIYVTDTWNQRVQSFTPSPDGLAFTPLRQWDVAGWSGQSLENKPFIAVDHLGHVFVTDPEGFRVIEYTTDGQLIQTWGDYGNSPTTFGTASGIAVDAAGSIWTSDSGNNRIMRFTLP
jgi:predicted membrane-bound mannosyltransferase/DNA-binding beta-propeller fold protein YncE